jgi:hypothetical protein
MLAPSSEIFSASFLPGIKPIFAIVVIVFFGFCFSAFYFWLQFSEFFSSFVGF